MGREVISLLFLLPKGIFAVAAAGLVGRDVKIAKNDFFPLAKMRIYFML